MSLILPSSARRLAARVLLLATALGLCACRTAGLKPGETLPRTSNVEQKAAPALYAWNGESLTGGIAVTIDLSEQKAVITRGGEVAGWTYVASGKPGYGTRTGSFSISEKVVDKVSTSWGQVVNSDGGVVVADAKAGRDGGGRFVGAPMPFWMRFNGAIGMHAGPIPNPGSPASHGCVRLPPGMAEILFGLAEIGTPVRVVP